MKKEKLMRQIVISPQELDLSRNGEEYEDHLLKQAFIALGLEYAQRNTDVETYYEYWNYKIGRLDQFPEEQDEKHLKLLGKYYRLTLE
jgi:hypothetical protein